MGASILLTGATGYIGGRLLRRFEAGGRPVRCLVRTRSKLTQSAGRTEVVEGDCLNEASLDRSMQGIETAYYLVHSLEAGAGFADMDRRAAENFGRAAARAGVSRIIYLGGLTATGSTLSPHLKSRADTGAVLRASGVPVIELRASIVIGAGSLSYQMIEALVERLPVMVCPRWVATLTQPIAIDDVLAYLEGASQLGDARNHKIVEIGGRDVVSYGDMMREYARQRGLRRILLPVPLLTPRLSGLWLALVAPAQARIGRALIEGLKNTTVVRSPEPAADFDVTPMGLTDAIARAIDEGTERRLKRDSRTTIVNASAERAFEPIRRIGGASGWYFGNSLWALRGRLDSWAGGVGMIRGRRHADECSVGDHIDGWTVVAFEPRRRLRLAADLWLPGRGWLEFEVLPLGAGSRTLIRQTASFDARGLLGRAYWYGVLPVHALMFRGLLKRIAQRAERPDRDAVTVTCSSMVPATSAELFRWHQQPEALQLLLPSRWIRIDHRSGGIGDGDDVAFSLGISRWRVRWFAQHVGYRRNREFSDVQVRGPFRSWQHVHRFEPIGNWQCFYEDQVTFALRGGRWTQWLVPLARTAVRRMLERRHRLVRARFARPDATPLKMTDAQAQLPP